MASFSEANRTRLELKMKFSMYSWYSSSSVSSDDGGYSVVIFVKNIDNKVKKIIPPVVNGVSIKTELE